MSENDGSLHRTKLRRLKQWQDEGKGKVLLMRLTKRNRQKTATDAHQFNN